MAALTDQHIVCRTCLKVVDTRGFTFIDDDNGYVRNVGNIREMLQFCLPELDLYISPDPVICYQCLPILVQVYNFKIKSLNVESTIRSYITKRELPENSVVNLNKVLREDMMENLTCKLVRNKLPVKEDVQKAVNTDLKIIVDDDSSEELEVQRQEPELVTIRKDLFKPNVLLTLKDKTKPAENVNIQPITPRIVAVQSLQDNEEEEDDDDDDEDAEIEFKKNYHCNKCDFHTDDVIKMYDHNRTQHNFDYTCQHCPFSTSKVELLGKHMSMVHPENIASHRNLKFKISENYACALCPFSVKSVDLLRAHQSTVHKREYNDKPIILNSGIKDEGGGTPKILRHVEYTCNVCPYHTRDKSNLRKHLFTHGTKPLKCDHCTYKCVSPYQLRRHQKQRHPRHLGQRLRNRRYELPNLQPSDTNGIRDSIKVELIA